MLGKGAPDWERIVVGPGGTPIGAGGLNYVSATAAANVDLAPGASAPIVALGGLTEGTWLVLGQVAPFWPGTTGTYGWAASYGTSASGSIVLGGGSTYDQRDISATEVETFYTYPMFGCLVTAGPTGTTVTMTVAASASNPDHLTFLGPGTPANPNCYILALQLA
jgi:hypothetical protein